MSIEILLHKQCQGSGSGAMVWPLHVTLIPDLVLARATLYVLDD
jgi:hypothetical protein